MTRRGGPRAAAGGAAEPAVDDAALRRTADRLRDAFPDEDERVVLRAVATTRIDLREHGTEPAAPLVEGRARELLANPGVIVLDSELEPVLVGPGREAR